MAGSKTAKKNQVAKITGPVKPDPRAGLTRHRVMRPSGKTVLVWKDAGGNEVDV